MKWREFEAGPEDWHLVPDSPPRRDGIPIADDVLEEMGVDVSNRR